jgi:hypothetical protein
MQKSDCVKALAPVALVALAALSACSTPSNPSYPCPVAGVLGDAETLTDFRGGQDPTNLVRHATISDVSLTCGYNIKKRIVNSKLAFTITLDKGPAEQAGSVTIPYFVAISRGGKYVLARKAFTRTLSYGDASRVSERETVPDIHIPLAEGLQGNSYQVIVGLELTPAELGYNRARKAAR